MIKEKRKLKIDNEVKYYRAMFRGMKIVVRDSQNNEYYCTLTEDLFELIVDNTPVVVFEKDTMIQHQFIRRFLEFVSISFYF